MSTLACLRCCECDSELEGIRRLEAHLSAVHLQLLPYNCQTCEFVFLPSEDAFVQHCKNIHNLKVATIACTLDVEKKLQLSEMLNRSVAQWQRKTADTIDDADDSTTSLEQLATPHVPVPPTPGQTPAEIPPTAGQISATPAASKRKSTTSSDGKNKRKRKANPAATVAPQTDIYTESNNEMQTQNDHITKQSRGDRSRTFNRYSVLPYEEALATSRAMVTAEGVTPDKWAKRFVWIQLRNTMSPDQLKGLKGTIQTATPRDCNSLEEYCSQFPRAVYQVVMSALNECGKLNPDGADSAVEYERQMIREAKALAQYIQNSVNIFTSKSKEQ